MTREEKLALVRKVPFWFHSIDLGDGVITPGRRDLQGMHAKWSACQMPDLGGKSVLDIGTWDGFFAFEAERRGAKRVIAMDRHIWELDIAHSEVVDRMMSAGTIDLRRVPKYWRPGDLPTKVGFDTAHQIMESKVEQVVDDLMTVDVTRLGAFDVVFYLGGLYHMEDPLGAMRRLAILTRGIAIIETQGIEIPALPDACLMEFYPFGDLNRDPSNWFAPTSHALIGLCKAAGFRDAKLVARAGRSEITPGFFRVRFFVHAYH